MELLEFVLYNYNQKNDLVVETLLPVIDAISKSNDIDENLKREAYKALGLARGYTEYKAKELAVILGVSKTAIKFMTNSLIDEGKIELVKENNITFLNPIFV